jgi:hypothetical protein
MTAATIPDYAKDKVATATKKDIVVNYPKLKQLNPNQDATRAEVGDDGLSSVGGCQAS